MTTAGLDAVLTLAQRCLGVMQPRPVSTLHVGGKLTVDAGLTLTAGPLALPAGSITTAMLAANATSLLIGNYQAISGFVPSQANVWQDTNMGLTVGLTGPGTVVRIEFSCSCFVPAGATVGIGIMINSSTRWTNLCVLQNGNASGLILPFSGVVYLTAPLAGSTRISVCMNASTLSAHFDGGAFGTLWITEQRR